MQGTGKRFVCILRSATNAARHHLGVTEDPDGRLERHNHGPCRHTFSDRPWSSVVVLEFPTGPQAVRVEKYLESGSGRAFATRHLRPESR